MVRLTALHSIHTSAARPAASVDCLEQAIPRIIGSESGPSELGSNRTDCLRSEKSGMESPLDVLSRAASMLKNSEEHQASIKRGMEQRESPPKELPTKMSKCKRMKERRLSPPANSMTQEEIERAAERKCAGTQTAFSSFPRDAYPLEMFPHSNFPRLDLDPSRGQGHAPGHRSPPMYHPALPHMNGMALPPHRVSPPHSASRSPPPHDEEDMDSAPLNLSVSGSSPTSVKKEDSSYSHSQTVNYTFQGPRPSVITCAPHSPSGQHHALNGHATHPTEHSTNLMSTGIRPRAKTEGHTAEECDPIEEHFRRSLGMEYPKLVTPQRTPSPEPRLSPPTVAPSSPTRSASDSVASSEAAVNMSVVGAVDEHFAKSLGATWTQLKAQEAETEQPGSVDDHFAKALGGDTWRRIRAETEGRVSNGASPNPSPNLSPRGSPMSQMLRS